MLRGVPGAHCPCWEIGYFYDENVGILLIGRNKYETYSGVFRSRKSPKKELVYQGTGWEWGKNQALRQIARYS